MESGAVADTQKRGRGRPRKNLNNSANMLRLACANQAALDQNEKRKHSIDRKELLSAVNGEIGSEMKKQKMDDQAKADDAAMQRTRLQPHRAARFTESYRGTPDVILLSDEEKQPNGECSSYDDSDSDCEMIPMSPPKELSKKELLEWENHIQTLQKELRNEEIKLMLLKKLKHSQVVKEESKPPETTDSSVPPHLANLRHKTSSLALKETVASSAPGPPSKHLMPANKHLPRPPLLGDHNKDIRPVHKSSPCNVTLPSQIIMKPSVTIRPISSSSQSTGYSQKPHVTTVQNQVSVSLVPASKTSITSAQHEKIDAETSAQRQAAAKLALRKQLEKTLLLIPPPKPPPPQLNFLPNANSPEFMWLLGLNVVVDFITKSNRSASIAKEPFFCTLCKTNFTTTWKWQGKEKRGKKDFKVICEACASSNVKKSLKAEHTNRLKSAFVKALQQEKEIERLAQSFSISPSISVVPIYTTSTGNTATSQHASNASMFSTTRTATSSTTMCHTNPSTLMQQFPKLSPQLQSLLQAQGTNMVAPNLPLPAHMLSLSSLVPQYPYHLLGKTPVSQTDLQRQYLLDMIPPRSSSRSPANWKA